jgi:hypothetical protein|tara:strand:+ start:2578 stop:2739 length:162 start_codon:yes stop_codon:yes gene_type:complete
MYSLNCSYFDKEFDLITDLLKYIVENGMDPNYEITRNGMVLEETAYDLIPKPR